MATRQPARRFISCSRPNPAARCWSSRCARPASPASRRSSFSTCRAPKGNIRSYVGALALTNRRLLGTLSAVPKKAGRDVNHQWTNASGSMVQAALDEGGLTLDVPPKFVYSVCGVPRG